EVEGERPHHGVALAGDLVRQRVDVGEQAVAQPAVTGHDLLGPLTERPQLVLVTRRAVEAEDRAEGAVLEPADDRLAAPVPAGEPADVAGPVGHARGTEVEPGGDLLAEGVPVVLDVARPDGGGVALLPGVARAG